MEKEWQRLHSSHVSDQLEGAGSPRTLGYINSKCDLFILQGQGEALPPRKPKWQLDYSHQSLPEVTHEKGLCKLHKIEVTLLRVSLLPPIRGHNSLFLVGGIG